MKFYTDVYVTPSRMQGLLRLIRKTPCSPSIAARLIEAALPKPGGEKKASQVLLAAKEAKLVAQQQQDGVLNLNFDAPETAWDDNQIATELPRIIDRFLLEPEIDGRENQFATLAAWLMCQSPSKMPQGHSAIKKALSDCGLPFGDYGLGNDACVDMLFYWFKYVGLTWQHEDSLCEGLVPDPTAYLLRHLDELVPKGTRVATHDFREELGRLCPVLDGGTVRAKILNILEENNQPVPPADQLSPALSFALRRLKRRNRIRYWCPDDQRTFLVLSNGEKIAFIEREEADPK